MSTFLLIHNGFAGGWVWQKVAAYLEEKQHDVFAPTLTGLAERAHLATPQTDLDIHIHDIHSLITEQKIKNIILVGSSWGGMVTTGVANRCYEHISKLVYIDTLIPRHGQSWLDLLPPQFAAHLKKIVAKDGDGWRIPVYRDDAPKWSDHPYKSVTQPVVLDSPPVFEIPRTFIHCVDKPQDYHFGMTPHIAMHAKKAQKNGWKYYEIKTPHLAMLYKPKELAELLNTLT